MAKIQPYDNFQLFFKDKGDGTFDLTVTPLKKSEGYPEKTINIPKATFDQLGYHFAKAIDDKNNISKLVYIV